MGKRHLAAVSVLSLFFVLVLAATAEAASPTQQLKQTIDQALVVVEDATLEDIDKIKHLRQIIAPRLDFVEMSRRVLGTYWPANAKREPEFTPLFRQLLERTYVKNVWLKEGRGIKIVYRNERVEDGLATVETTLTTAKGSEIPVGYRLHLTGGEWKVYDISIEGVSLVNNYRVQFRSILSKHSFDELLARMRKRVEEVKKE